MIKISFTGHYHVSLMDTPTIVLTMDEEGYKEASVEHDSLIFILKAAISDREADQKPPVRLMRAFTESAVEMILAKDEIPDELDYRIDDGYSYKIIITKDEITKEYHADDSSVKTYPLLKYLASWSRRLIK